MEKKKLLSDFLQDTNIYKLSENKVFVLSTVLVWNRYQFFQCKGNNSHLKKTIILESKWEYAKGLLYQTERELTHFLVRSRL